MKDPYDILGVRRTDSDESIRKAYRKLAKKHHPDLNAGKADAADQFMEINAANDFLADPVRRGRFDRGEINADGQEAAPRGFHRPGGASGGANAGARRAASPGGLDAEELERLFGGLGAHGFGGFAGAGGNPARAGADLSYALEVDFLEAARGVVRRLPLPDGRSLDVTVPPGMSDRGVLRLRGQGRAGALGGPAGDALVEVRVRPHPYFRREGNDIVLRLPVNLTEAVLGATIDVPTIRGRVRLAIPANSANGARLRLRGRGIDDGHQFVELTVTLPSAPEPELAAFLARWTPEHAQDPRADLDDI